MVISWLLNSNVNSSVTATVASTKHFQKTKGRMVDKMMCSYCHFTNYTIEKCFKLHGYPPGHPRYNHSQYQHKGQAHQVSSNAEFSSNASTDNLTQNQCSQLIEFLSTKLQARNGFSMEVQQQEPVISCITGYKGYKLLNMDTNDVFISRDVSFHEYVFLFKENSSSSIPFEFFLDNVLPNHMPSSFSPESSSQPTSVQSQRIHSKCTSHKPSHLKDYYCYMAKYPFESSTAHPLCSVVDSSKLSLPYKAFINNISSVLEPETYSQVVALPE
ncbi:uncharacterized protein [Henckelia pumila]|uniref:uncharacterized protein n=1 Tax=Henckelia pumila TaxID=405737 RepID=UPI003C6DC954